MRAMTLSTLPFKDERRNYNLFLAGKAPETKVEEPKAKPKS